MPRLKYMNDNYRNWLNVPNPSPVGVKGILLRWNNGLYVCIRKTSSDQSSLLAGCSVICSMVSMVAVSMVAL